MDTISIAERLQSAGMDEPVAKAVAKEAVRATEPAAMKSDIDRLERAIRNLRETISRRR